MKKYGLIMVSVLLILFTGCQNTRDDTTNETDQEPVIYTSIYPIQYLVEQIGKGVVSVESVYPPGVDAHTYEPASKDITNISQGDAFIYLGAGMESFAETTKEALDSQDIVFVEMGKHEELFLNSDGHEHDHGDDEDAHAHNHDDEHEHGDDEDAHAHDHDDEHDHGDESHEHNHGDLDPHIWLDPIRMIDMGEIITQELNALYPEQKDVFQENFARLEKDLQELDQDFHHILDSKEDKSLLVSHAAFGYWEEIYDIEQLSINGLSSSDEPSQKDLAAIATLADKKNIEYVIYDQTGSNHTSEIIQEHIGAEKRVLHNLETLTEDDINEEEDYLSIMRNNLDILDEATN